MELTRYFITYEFDFNDAQADHTPPAYSGGATLVSTPETSGLK